MSGLQSSNQPGFPVLNFCFAQPGPYNVNFTLNLEAKAGNESAPAALRHYGAAAHPAPAPGVGFDQPRQIKIYQGELTSSSTDRPIAATFNAQSHSGNYMPSPDYERRSGTTGSSSIDSFHLFVPTYTSSPIAME